MARKEEKTIPSSSRQKKPASPKGGEDSLSTGREVASILVIAFALLTFLSLFSYHPYDPGLFSFGTETVSPENWVGILGAYWASTLFFLFGFFALYVPLIATVTGVLIFLGRSLFRPWRCVLWGSMILSQAGLFQFVLGEVPYPLFGQDILVAPGGFIGLNVVALLERGIGTVGAGVVLPVWTLLTLMLFFRVSLKKVAVKTLTPFGKLWNSWRVRREKKKQQVGREKMVEEVRKKQQERMDRLEKGAEEKPLPIARTKEVAPALPLEAPPDRGYRLPPTNLLDPPKPQPPVDEKHLRDTAARIEHRLQEFDIAGEVVEVHPGPVVTIYEFKPAPGVKYNRITALQNDLALSLKTDSLRVSRVSGKSHVGIEVPNRKRELIYFRELIESSAYADTWGKLPLALGKTVEGGPYITTLDFMPHLLIAGTTGSGKSVGMNALIHSILFRSSPDEVKFIMVDPKQVELKVYEGLPHLLTPVVTDVKKAANALNWAVREMTERYKLLASTKVRSIDEYNAYVRTLTPSSLEDGSGLDRPLPYIVIVIDELYDLMATVAKEVEMAIARLSAMARAVGIHLILATQRPSRDVITGVIKSNLPSRIAFQVREKLESRLILDQNGAEMLEGKGDMLFLPPGSGRLIRIHGGYISNAETQRVINYLIKQGQPEYDTQVLKGGPALSEAHLDATDGELEEDPLYQDALSLIVRTGTASASNLQRKLRVGYARAARLLDIMEQRGVVGPVDGAKRREILINPDEVE